MEFFKVFFEVCPFYTHFDLCINSNINDSHLVDISETPPSEPQKPVLLACSETSCPSSARP